MKLIIDTKVEKVYMGDGEESPQITKSGYQLADVLTNFQTEHQSWGCTINIMCLDDSRKCAKHLHSYFAHSSANKLKPFIKSASLPNEKEIIEILENVDKP